MLDQANCSCYFTSTLSNSSYLLTTGQQLEQVFFVSSTYLLTFYDACITYCQKAYDSELFLLQIMNILLWSCALHLITGHCLSILTFTSLCSSASQHYVIYDMRITSRCKLVFTHDSFTQCWCHNHVQKSFWSAVTIKLDKLPQNASICCFCEILTR